MQPATAHTARIPTAARGLTLACLLLGAVVLSACGGTSTAATSPASSDAARTQARLAFASCMRRNGVNIPDPGTADGPGAGPRNVNRNSPAFQKAFTACRPLLARAFGNISSADRARFRASLLKFTSCLRSHGLNVADPSPTAGGPGGGGGFGGPFRSIDRNSPAFQAAAKACQSVRPQRPGGGGAGGGFGGPGGPG